MKLDIVAGSGNDEFYTPEYAIIPLIKHLKLSNIKKVWCPFDTDRSMFVKVLRREGFLVYPTHIDGGKDFFSLNVKCDAIISNPPYSKKFEVFERLFKLGKPFAMLVGVVGLFESKKRFDLFRNNKFETMYFDKRVSYFKNYDDPKPSLNPPFSSIYLCSGILKDRIVFEEIVKQDRICQ